MAAARHPVQLHREVFTQIKRLACDKSIAEQRVITMGDIVALAVKQAFIEQEKRHEINRVRDQNI